MTSAPVRLSRHQSAAWLLAPPVLLTAPVVGLAIGRLVDGPDELERISGESADWSLPLLFVAAAAAMFVVCWIISVLVLRAGERRDVRRVLAEPIASWPQYASVEQWTAFVASEREAAGGTRLVSLAPVAAVAATGGGVALGSSLGSATFGGALGGFVGALLLAGWGSRLRTSRYGHALDRHRDRVVGTPRRTVSTHGVLDDDLGVTSFTHLAGVSHVDSADVLPRRAAVAAARRQGHVIAKLDPIDRRLAKAGWSFLELTFDQRVTHGFAPRLLRLLEPWYARSTGMRWVELVRVPPAASAEADAVVAALRSEYQLGPERAPRS
jgi:hypothetical protein